MGLCNAESQNVYGGKESLRRNLKKPFFHKKKMVVIHILRKKIRDTTTGNVDRSIFSHLYLNSN